MICHRKFGLRQTDVAVKRTDLKAQEQRERERQIERQDDCGVGKYLEHPPAILLPTIKHSQSAEDQK